MREIRRSVRAGSYYGGDVDLVLPVPGFGPHDYTDQYPFIEWRAYEGGSATMELLWDEAERLRDALTELLTMRREAPRGVGWGGGD